MVSITVIIPTIRDASLNERCLKRQTFKDFETIIQRPTRPKPEGYFYQLNYDYNQAVKKAKGELIISYQDMIEIRPDCLERFWEHYKTNAKAIVGAVGDQYSSFDPPVKVWIDPRKRLDQGSFYECLEEDVEYTLCSIPKQAIFDVGGFDEYFDHYPAISEKELNARMYKAGYKFYLDQSIEYRAIHHPRMTDNWDEKYNEGCIYYAKCLEEIKEGKRLTLDFLK